MIKNHLTVQWPDTAEPGYNGTLRCKVIEAWFDQGANVIALGPDGEPIVPTDWQERIMGR